MRLFGLIGNPVAHSQSPDYFHQKWENEGITDCRYLLFPLENIRQLPSLIQQHPELHGLNVTSPFKEKVLEYADAVDTDACRLQSANVLQIRQGKITAFNTDHLGFDRLLSECPQRPETALICGNGGAARAAAYSLKRHGTNSCMLSRTPAGTCLSYDMLSGEMLNNFSLIVNATPLGMGELQTECPHLPYHALHKKHILIDLIYQPAETVFLQKGKAAGCYCLNGLSMLHAQADEAWNIWKRC